MTLTEAAFWTKRFGVIAVFLMTAFVVAIIISLNKNGDDGDLAKYLVPNYACTQTSQEFLKDKLKLTSAVELGEGSQWSFNVQTKEGIVNNLALEVAYVYRYIDVTQSIQSLAHARTIAQNLGFDETKVKATGDKTMYVVKDNTHEMNLAISAKTENFSYSTDIKYISDTCRKGSVPDYSTALTAAKSALGSSALNLDMSEWITDDEPTYISIEKNGDSYYYTKARAKADANLIKIDFSRKRSLISFAKDISAAETWKDKLSAMTGLDYSESSRMIGDSRIDYYTYDTVVGITRLQNSNISVYVGCEDKARENRTTKSIYQIDYAYWPIETEPCGSYPLISANMAVQALQNGNIKDMGGASLAYLYRKNDDDITDELHDKKNKSLVVNQFRIQTVNFAYYELESNLDHLIYLEPIYVISGEADLKDGTTATFHFYYPAIDYANVKDSTATSTETLQE